MRNDLIVGIACCFIGSYNFYSFYHQNKLYAFNFSFYASTFMIGIIFLLKAKITYHTIQSQIQSKVIPPSPMENKETVSSESIAAVQVELLNENSNKHIKISSLLKKTESEYKLKKVYLIRNEKTKSKFKNYQQDLSQKFKCEGLQGTANTNYNFHGTRKACNLDPCDGAEWRNCPLCSIIKNGFQLKFSGKGPSTDLRFGNGIYFSPDLKKALNYTESQQKAVLLMTKVAMGKVYYAKDSESHLEEFNENLYQSICGDPRVTYGLKQPEICVFKEEACWPKFMIEFEKK